LFHAFEETDMAKLIVSFHNFADAYNDQKTKVQTNSAVYSTNARKMYHLNWPTANLSFFSEKCVQC